MAHQLFTTRGERQAKSRQICLSINHRKQASAALAFNDARYAAQLRRAHRVSFLACSCKLEWKQIVGRRDAFSNADGHEIRIRVKPGPSWMLKEAC